MEKEKQYGVEPKAPSPAETTTIAISNLTRNVHTGHLKEIFSPYGEIVYEELLDEKAASDKTQFKIGYVTYRTRAAAESAVNVLDQGQIDGVTVRVAILPRNRVPLSAITDNQRPFLLSHLRKTDIYRGKGSFKHQNSAGSAETKRARWSKVKARQNDLLVRLQQIDQRVSNLEDSLLPVKPFEDTDPQTKQRLIQQIFSMLNDQERIPPEKVVNIYLYGSKWFGDCRVESDYDFIAIVKDWKRPVTSDSFHVIESGNEIDVTVYSVEEFQLMINKQHSWVLNLMLFPPEGLWLEKHKFEWCLELPALLRAVKDDCLLNLNIARRYWTKGMIRKSKKRICFVIRMIDFAIQLTKEGRIYHPRGTPPAYYAQIFADEKTYPLEGFFDAERHTEFRSFVGDVLSAVVPDWNEFKFRWYPAVHHMVNCLERLIVPKWKLEEGSKVDSLVSYLKSHSVVELQRNFSIQHCSWGAENRRVLRYSYCSPSGSQIVNECDGALVERENNSWKVLCAPLRRIWSIAKIEASLARLNRKETTEDTTDDNTREQSEKETLLDKKKTLCNIAWDRGVEIFPLLDGVYATVFFDGASAKWNVLFNRIERDEKRRAQQTREFWRTFEELGYKLPRDEYHSKCFVFQFASPFTSKLPRYESERNSLLLTHVKDLSSDFYERSLEKYVEECGFVCVPKWRNSVTSVEQFRTFETGHRSALYRGFIATELESSRKSLKISHRLYKLCRDIHKHTDLSHVKNQLLSFALLSPSDEWNERARACIRDAASLAALHQLAERRRLAPPEESQRERAQKDEVTVHQLLAYFDGVSVKVRKFCGGVDEVYESCVKNIKGLDRYAEFSRYTSEWQFAPLLVSLWHAGGIRTADYFSSPLQTVHFRVRSALEQWLEDC